MDKSPKKKTWHGRLHQAGKLKTVCWLFKRRLLDFLKDERRILSTLCSIIKLCIIKDNPFVPLLPAPISVRQMRKSLKLVCQGLILEPDRVK